ncbi:MAG: hypothetical protein GY913_25365 [Proteobacteria bacterium]|nr:hypothetical protein [Pseudomonadota bacterium]MCP4920243.1 hypothetical protein [Pseudomonadota bacterium]
MASLPKLRTAFMILVAGFMLVGPFLRQVAGVHHPYVRRWVMFSGYGSDICDLRLYSVQDDGSLQRESRCELLGYNDCADMPKPMWRANTFTEVNGQLRQICRNHEGDVELRATARCGAYQGWKSKYSGEQDICTVEAVIAPRGGG